jgi:integrase
MKKTRGSLEKINFTKRSLEAITTPKDRRVTIYDAQTRGLGLLIRPVPSGRRSYFWYRKVRGVNQWHTIGDAQDLSVEQARAKAGAFNTELAKWKADDYTGRAPTFEKRAEPTLSTVNEDYCERHLRSHAKNPDRAIRETKRTFTNHLDQWKDRKLGSITRSNVRDLHAAVGEKVGQYAANRVLQNLRALLNWAIKEEIWSGENPAARIQQFHEKRRTRFLSPDEMERLFATLSKEPTPDVADFVLLLLMTGARKSNVTAMRWDQITFETSSWEILDPKNREPYTIALVPEAIDILKRRKNETPWVFPSRGPSGHVLDFKRSWRQVLKRAKIENLRQHDVRRTLGAWQAAQGASLQMIGKSLGHKSIAASAIYSPMQLDTVRSSVHAATSAMLLAAKTDRQKLLAAARKRKQLCGRQ